MKESITILKGDFVFSDLNRNLKCLNNQYLLISDGIIADICPVLPDQYKNIKVQDYTGKIIIPGLTDLHVHAPQYAFRGIGMDKELLDWLNAHTFPEEAKFADREYADRAYSIFVKDLKESATTRACIFATIHKEATLNLMDKLEKSGLITYTGKVNMDRNSPDILRETDAQKAADATEEWINRAASFTNTKAILTPRFVPSCTDELMRKLGILQSKYKLRIQSHLSENPSEINWVKELVPSSKGYADAYRIFNLSGDKDTPAIMAHCVWSNEEERELLKKHGTFVAHCPESNLNLSSGIAPVRKYLEEGINIGLGSDIAAGSGLSIFRQIVHAIQSSKIYWRYIDSNVKPLSFADAFYIATAGGGRWFGKTGTFIKGYDADIVVLDDSSIESTLKLTAEQRLERASYMDDKVKICAKYVKGNRLF